MSEPGQSDTDPYVAVAERSRGLSDGDQSPVGMPAGRNPNEQSYWDGERYTDIRHWVGGQGWVEGAIDAHSSDPSASGSVGSSWAQPQIHTGRRAHGLRHPSASGGCG